MKKGFLLSFITLGLLLTSCGSGLSSLEDKGTNVLTPSMIENNIPVLEEEINDVKIPSVFSTYDKNLTDTYDAVNTNYANLGLYVVTNKYGYTGFYSSISQKFIVNPSFKSEWLYYNVLPMDTLGFGLQIFYQDEELYYDAFGNSLDFVDSSLRDIYEVEYRGLTPYVTYFETDGDTHYFKYEKNGIATPVDFIPTETPTIDEEILPHPSIGELLQVGYVDLSGYGLNLKNHTIAYSKTGLTTVYNGERIVSTFNIESDAEISGIVGEELIYQLYLELPEDTTDYSYYEDGTKYELITKRVDLKTGKKTDYNVGVVFDEIRPIYEADKTVNYYGVRYRNITQKKILSSYMMRIADTKLALYDDISGLYIPNTVKIDDGRYFDFYNKILFDESMKPISYMANVNPVYINSEKVFLTQYNGLYGLADINGRVIAENLYDRIYTEYAKNGYFIGVKDNEVYRIDVNNDYMGDEFIGVEPRVIDENFFKCYGSNDETIYFNSESNIHSIYQHGSTVKLHKHSLIYDQEYYTIELQNDDVFTGRNIIINSFKYDNCIISVKTNRVEKTTSVNTGKTFEDPVQINEGSNKVWKIANPSSTSYVYTKFTSSAAGYYFFYVDTDYSLSTVYANDGSSESTCTIKSATRSTVYDENGYSLYRYAVKLESKETVIIKFYTNYYSTSERSIDINVQYSYGWNSSYPIQYSFSDSYRKNKAEIYDFESNDYDTFRISLIIEQDAYYKFKLNSSTYSSAYITVNGTSYNQNGDIAGYEGQTITIVVDLNTYPTADVAYTITRDTTRKPPKPGYTTKEAININYVSSYSYASSTEVFHYNATKAYFKYTESGNGGYYRAYAGYSSNGTNYINSISIYNNTSLTGTSTSVSNPFFLEKGQTALITVDLSTSYSSYIFYNMYAYVTAASSYSTSNSMLNPSYSIGSYSNTSGTLGYSYRYVYYNFDSNYSYETHFTLNAYLYSNTSSYNDNVDYYIIKGGKTSSIEPGERISVASYENFILYAHYNSSSGTSGNTLYMRYSIAAPADSSNDFTLSSGSGGYQFSQSGNTFTNTNQQIDSSTCSLRLTANTSISLTISYTVSSESNCDKFTITKNSSTTYVSGVSGSVSNTITVSLVAGDYLDFTYTKDSSLSNGSDTATFTLTY